MPIGKLEWTSNCGVTELLTGTDVWENIVLICDVDMTEPENEFLNGRALETFPRVSAMWLQGCKIGVYFALLYINPQW